ncbi:MAG TPA: hypothetical protein DER11_04170 [Janibacter terrae]|nr:hypothetical protein [Kytococcus sp.]HCE60595.1 hypothetical protein [Janibacter terrae]
MRGSSREQPSWQTARRHRRQPRSRSRDRARRRSAGTRCRPGRPPRWHRTSVLARRPWPARARCVLRPGRGVPRRRRRSRRG